jgi:flagellar export protein FliJ
MKTPYDAARRIRRRELDDVRQALSAAEAQLSAFAAMIERTGAALERERAVAAADPRCDIGRYATAKRVEIERLHREMARIETEIEHLRAQLTSTFEALKPLDFASEEYRSAKRRETAKRDMAKLDEAAARRRR